jgi:hypothetical protein
MSDAGGGDVKSYLAQVLRRALLVHQMLCTMIFYGGVDDMLTRAMWISSLKMDQRFHCGNSEVRA